MSSPRIMITRKITELEALRFFRLYKYHHQIIETVAGGRSWVRGDIKDVDASQKDLVKIALVK